MAQIQMLMLLLLACLGHTVNAFGQSSRNEYLATCIAQSKRVPPERKLETCRCMLRNLENLRETDFTILIRSWNNQLPKKTNTDIDMLLDYEYQVATRCVRNPR
jgi:hypothetical protein